MLLGYFSKNPSVESTHILLPRDANPQLCQQWSNIKLSTERGNTISTCRIFRQKVFNGQLFPRRLPYLAANFTFDCCAVHKVGNNVIGNKSRLFNLICKNWLFETIESQTFVCLWTVVNNQIFDSRNISFDFGSIFLREYYKVTF